MHFITFPVATTNIFPLVNSKNGGQLVTEYYLKSRESVATNPSVKYSIGPSFIHSLDDFKVTALQSNDMPLYSDGRRYNKGDYCTYNDLIYLCISTITSPEPFNSNHWRNVSVASSNSILQVGVGRAVINGHYVESLAPMTIDLNATNAELLMQSRHALYGNLSIGIKSYFSTSSTMSGTMLVENEDDMYIGIQLVIEKASEFITPNDSPDNPNLVNADIKLADFTYVNGTINAESIRMNANAIKYISSDRITNFDSVLNDKYVTSENLVDRMFYTYSGKSGWCDSTGELMTWDSNPEQHIVHVDTEQGEEFHTVGESQFVTSYDGNIDLVVPHKQQDAPIYDDAGKRLYYADKYIPVPVADYNTESSGIVTKAYTKRIKAVEDIISTYKQFTNGKQVTYWDSLKYNSLGQYDHEFPDASKLNVGDYIIVREDYTAHSTTSTSSVSAPTTMYFVLPGMITSIKWNGKVKPSGIQLGTTGTMWSGDHPEPPSILDPDKDELLNIFGYNNLTGTTDDYFELIYRNRTDTEGVSYYYQVDTTTAQMWSAPTALNGGIYLATNSQIGGFFNAPSDATDAGYVYLDNNGHLRLMDYGLLRSGTLAYQLGEDITVPSNSTLSYIQEYLDNYVNTRIVFPFTTSLSPTPPMINIYLTLPKDASGDINIYNLDSRFGAGAYLHILTSDKDGDYSNIRINILDCGKIRIDNSFTVDLIKGPVINIFRSCLYYDAAIIDYVRTCDTSDSRSSMFYEGFTGFDGLTLWYSRFSSSDPDLIVNGMEISQPNVAMTTEDISYWDEDVTGDNHYAYALRSITLSNSGKLIACSLYVSNNSTQPAVIDSAQHTIIGGKFKLPKGPALNYPMSCVNSPLQITGTFTTAYLDNTQTKWITTDTTFTAKSGTYSNANGLSDGTIAFNSNTYLIDSNFTNVTSIDGWAPGSYHIFYGGTTI